MLRGHISYQIHFVLHDLFHQFITKVPDEEDGENEDKDWGKGGTASNSGATDAFIIIVIVIVQDDDKRDIIKHFEIKMFD